jgi:hypothetical protein
MLIILGVLSCAVLIVFGAAKDWKLSIKAILVIVIIEGALRRWAFPQAKDLIYFFKDFILIGSYIGFASRTRLTVARYPAITLLTSLVAIVCCLQALNPGLGSPIIGLLGIRAYLLYIPLLWVVPHLFDSESELRIFLRNYLLLLIPVCLLGIVQFFSPIDSPLNVYIPGTEIEIATVGEFVRITGTFAYLSGFTVYLAVCFTLLIVLISQESKFKWQLIYSLELTLIVVNSLMSGARGIILYEILFIISYLICLSFSRPKIVLNFFSRLFLPTIIATVLAVVYFQPAIGSFSTRVDTAGDSFGDRIIDFFTQVFNYAEVTPIGYGTGATQGGAATLRSLLDLPSGVALPSYEVETGRVVLEIGILGFVFWYGLRIVILITLGVLFLRLKNPFHQELALALCLFQIINLPGALLVNSTMLVFYWFFSGFIYLLPELETKDISIVSLNEGKK